MTADNKNSRNKKTPAETAYAYLASRMRTTAEVRKHLLDKGFGREETEDTVRELTELTYLDDYQYALRYYEYNHEKKRGALRAARELAEKGIDAETIRNAREDYLYSSGADEFEDALAIAEREIELKADRPSPDDREKLLARIARRLENKGFGRDIIFRVLDRLRSDIEASDYE